MPNRINPNLPRNRNFLKLTDFTREELQEIIDLALLLKDAHREGVEIPLLKDKSFAILFQEPSLRTRVSFEVAMTELGGHALYISGDTIYPGQHEGLRDTAEILSRMVSGTVLRVGHHETMEEFARYAFTPVIDGCSSRTDEATHPTQIVADFITMREHMPDTPWEDMTVLRVGDLNMDPDHYGMMARCLSQMCAIFGLTFIACSPKGYEMSQVDIDYFNVVARESGAKILFTNDPYEYVGQADFIFADGFFYSSNDDPEYVQRRRKALMPYQVNQRLIGAAPHHVGVLHCLPGHRNDEITTEVWDGPNSLLFEEAENRLHAQKAILSWLLFEDGPSEETVKKHTDRVLEFMRSRPSRQG